jgi:hypothetical protein
MLSQGLSLGTPRSFSTAKRRLHGSAEDNRVLHPSTPALPVWALGIICFKNVLIYDCSRTDFVLFRLWLVSSVPQRVGSNSAAPSPQAGVAGKSGVRVGSPRIFQLLGNDALLGAGVGVAVVGRILTVGVAGVELGAGWTAATGAGR